MRDSKYRIVSSYYKVFAIAWEYSESGWGQEDGGYSLHPDLETATAFLNSYPDVFKSGKIKVRGSLPITIDVDKKTYRHVRKSKTVWESWEFVKSLE